MAACTTAAFPPLTCKEAPGDERPVGIDVDVIEEVARRLGSEVEYVTTDFAGLLPSLGSGRCDVIISGIYINDERRETYDGARYMKSATVIVTAGDDETVEAREDLSGRTLALESGTYYGEERVEPLNAALEAEGRAPVEVQQYPYQQDAM